MAATTPRSLQPGDAADLMPFTFDLTAHEIRRMTAVLDAMPNWDPAAVLAAEVEAHSLLYSGLNAEQRSGDDLLCEEGVGTTSDLHWRYLLANESRLLFLQCPSCLHRWWHDTEFGVVDNWPDPPDFPTSPGQAA